MRFELLREALVTTDEISQGNGERYGALLHPDYHRELTSECALRQCTGDVVRRGMIYVYSIVGTLDV